MNAASAETPLVYVIILTWNGKNDTLECLRSMKNITYPNARILVVDNASSDGTAKAIRKEFPDIELIVNRSNLRFAGGNNVGIRYAMSQGADYVLLLNNDTTVHPDFITHLVTVAQSDTNVGMVGPKIYYFGDPQRLWYAGGRIEWWKGWISHIGVREIDRGQFDGGGSTGYITGCCILVKREIVERIGVLDESYFIYGEDADWCVRAARAGYKLMYEPRAKVWHKLSVATGGHLSWFKNWNKLKSQLRLMARYAHSYHWLTIPVMMALQIAASYIRVKRFS